MTPPNSTPKKPDSGCGNLVTTFFKTFANFKYGILQASNRMDERFEQL